MEFLFHVNISSHFSSRIFEYLPQPPTSPQAWLLIHSFFPADHSFVYEGIFFLLKLITMLLKGLLTTLIIAFGPTLTGAVPTTTELNELELIKRQTADPACTNGPLSRGCWAGGFSISTDYEAKYPNTGKVVEVDISPHACSFSH
jgi:hypothetical protein